MLAASIALLASLRRRGLLGYWWCMAKNRKVVTAMSLAPDRVAKADRIAQLLSVVEGRSVSRSAVVEMALDLLDETYPRGALDLAVEQIRGAMQSDSVAQLRQRLQANKVDERRGGARPGAGRKSARVKQGELHTPAQAELRELEQVAGAVPVSEVREPVQFNQGEAREEGERREGDSNPRWVFGPHTISSRAP